LDGRLDGPQSQSGCGGEDKNSQPPAGIKPPNPNHPAHSQLLYQLLTSHKTASNDFGRMIIVTSLTHSYPPINLIFLKKYVYNK
jgi:hypothetical protein